jgi:hypothetical protein
MSVYFLFFRRLTSAFFFVSWITLMLMLWGNSLQAAPPAFSERDFRQTLNEHLLTGTANSALQENPIPPAIVRTILRENLDSSLLTRVLKTTGADFRFVISGQQTESQAGILIVSYRNEKIASDMAKRLAVRGAYFKHIKILTRFSHASVGNQLVVAFTENAGNEVVVKFIDEFPELLQKRH